MPKSSYRGNSNRPGRFRMVLDKGRPILNGAEFAKELKEMPDYSNTFTNEVEAKLGSFQFDQSESPRDSPLIDRGPLEMDNGCVYHGQWNNQNQREGQGTQIWKDGAKYTGYWKKDEAHGKGRIIHVNGDFYEG